jgi:hypothetical protein
MIYFCMKPIVGAIILRLQNVTINTCDINLLWFTFICWDSRFQIPIVDLGSSIDRPGISRFFGFFHFFDFGFLEFQLLTTL